MKTRPTCINTYLWLPLFAVAAALACGCKTTQPVKEDKIEKRDEASLRFYLEANIDGTDRTQPISIGRSSPFALGVETRSFLTEFNIDHASVVDSPGGFSIAVQFDKEGTWILEQYTGAHKTKRAAIAAEFGQIRWIAAPIMRERITNGMFVFTPDTTREEAEKIVAGVNRVAELVKSGRK